MEKVKRKNGIDTKQKLIEAGVSELTQYGLENFSTRRVAASCFVSCSAPYKHFRNTKEFINEILNFINKTYHDHQDEVIARVSGLSYRDQLLAVCMDYIDFLVAKPEFRKVIIQNFSSTDEEYRIIRRQLSRKTYEIVYYYCNEVNMSKEVRRRKSFIVRSIVYGAATFFSNGEMEYNEENISLVRSMLNREFDLP